LLGGVAMDARTMSAVLWLFAGLAGGVSHFALLRWNTLFYVKAGALAYAIGLQLLRLAVIASLLGLAAWHGALPLLLVGLGIVLARPVVLRVTQVVI
jgi:hypothetical protein